MKEKVCCVTGASQGIGKATAMRLVEEGAIVYAVALTDAPIIQWAQANGYQDQVIPIALDITDSAGIRALITRIRKEHGRLDVLVNNAAVEKNERIGMIAHNTMQTMFNVNVFALIELTQLAARMMLRTGSGSIINLASRVGERGNPGQAVYAATKGAVIAFTRSAAKELAPGNIRVNAVAPGLTDTAMFQAVDPQLMESRVKNICMGRLAKPEEIADAILFLASDESRFVSGQILAVDGCTII